MSSSSSSSATNCRRCRMRAIASTLTDGDRDFRRIWREETERLVVPLVDSVYNRFTNEFTAKMDRSRYGCDCGSQVVNRPERIEPDQNGQPNRTTISEGVAKYWVKRVFAGKLEDDDDEIFDFKEEEDEEEEEEEEKICKGENIMADSGQYREIPDSDNSSGPETLFQNESLPKDPGSSTTMMVLESSKDTATDDHHPLMDPPKYPSTSRTSSPPPPPPSSWTLFPTSRFSSTAINRSSLNRDLFPITSSTNGVTIVDSASDDRHRTNDVRTGDEYYKNIPENLHNIPENLQILPGTSSSYAGPSLSIQSTFFDRPCIQSRSLISNLYEETLEQVKRDSIALKSAHASQQEVEKDDDVMNFGQEVSNETTNAEAQCPETVVDDDTTITKEGSLGTTNKEVKEVEANKDDNGSKEKDSAMSKVALTTASSSSSIRTPAAHFTLPPVSVLQSLIVGEFIRWIFINFDTAAINGTYHQGDHDKFHYPGVQCVAMCACAIVRSYLIRLTKWNRYEAFDPILEQGDILYGDSWNLIPIPIQPESGHIFVNQLKKRNTLFGVETIFSFFDDPPLHGARFDQAHLLADLRFLFTKCLHGIVIAGGSARAVIQQGSLFYLFDSHSISPRGVPVPEGGRATIFYFFTLQKMAEKLFELINHGYVPPTGTEVGRDARQDQYLIDPIRVRFPNRTELVDSLHLDELDLDAYEGHRLAYSIESERIKAKKEEVTDGQMIPIGGDGARGRLNKLTSKKHSNDFIWINLDDDDDEEELEEEEKVEEEKVEEEFDDEETECEEEMLEMAEGNKEEGEKEAEVLAEPKQDIKDMKQENETMRMRHDCPPESPQKRKSQKRKSQKRQSQKRPLQKDSAAARSNKRARQSSPSKSFPVLRPRQSVPSKTRSAERSRRSVPSKTRSAERSRQSVPSKSVPVLRSRQWVPALVNQKQMTTLSLECDQEGCDQTEIAQSQFKQHMLSEHSIRPARCAVPECGESFSNAWILHRHVLHAHKDIDRWICAICGTGYGNYQGLASHTLNLHRRGQYRCTFASCDFTGECKRDVYNHYAREHKPKFVCDVRGCNFADPNEVVFKAHQRVHFDIRPYKCKWSQCGHTFVYKKVAMKHIRDHIASVENGDELKPEAFLEVDTDLLM